MTPETVGTFLCDRILYFAIFVLRSVGILPAITQFAGVTRESQRRIALRLAQTSRGMRRAHADALPAAPLPEAEDVIYVLGGTVAFGGLPSLQARLYRPRTNSWTNLAPIPAGFHTDLNVRVQPDSSPSGRRPAGIVGAAPYQGRVWVVGESRRT